MFKKLQTLLSRLGLYPEQEQQLIKGFAAEAGVLEAFDGMKQTEGWKILRTKIREELQQEILASVKENQKVQTLLNILGTVETKEAAKLLDEEIERVLPDD